MTRKISVASGEFEIVLPGTWACIPMTTPDAIRQRVAALIKKQIGVSDRLAQHRREVREQLVDASLQALAQEALSFAISLELVPGVPFPASMLTSRSSWPPRARDELAGETVKERLHRAFPEAQIVSPGGVAIARVAVCGTKQFGAASTESLGLDYWLPVPEATDLMHVIVSAPMAPGYEPFIKLFDAIVGTIGWQATPAALTRRRRRRLRPVPGACLDSLSR